MADDKQKEDEEKGNVVPRTASEIKSRATAAFSAMDNTSALVRDIYAFAMPNRDTHTAEQSRGDLVFDSTAISSTLRFAGRLQKDLTPPFQQWAVLNAGEAVRDKDKKIILNREYQYATKIVFAMLKAGGFTTASHEVYQDLAAGQGHMTMTPGVNVPCVYTAHDPRKCALEVDCNGNNIAFHIKNTISLIDLEKTFPNAKFSVELKKQIAEAKKATSPKDATAVAFQSYIGVGMGRHHDYYVVVNDERVETEHLLWQPYAVPRWSMMSGDKRGRGPLQIALPDIKTLNKVKELLLIAAALAILGVYTVVDDGVINVDTLSLTPGANIVVGSNGTQFQGPTLKPLETGRDLNLSQLLIQDLQLSIKKIMLDENLPPEFGAVRSPTEIIERAKALAIDSGAAFGRLMDEWLKPVIQTTLDIARAQPNLLISDILQPQKGGDDEVLDGNFTIDDLGLSLTILSPLARIQALNEIEGILQFIEIAKGIGGEEAPAIVVKIMDIISGMASQLGVPAEHINTENEQKKLLDAIAEAASDASDIEQGIEDNAPEQ